MPTSRGGISAGGKFTGWFGVPLEFLGTRVARASLGFDESGALGDGGT